MAFDSISDMVTCTNAPFCRHALFLSLPGLYTSLACHRFATGANHHHNHSPYQMIFRFGCQRFCWHFLVNDRISDCSVFCRFKSAILYNSLAFDRFATGARTTATICITIWFLRFDFRNDVQNLPNNTLSVVAGCCRLGAHVDKCCIYACVFLTNFFCSISWLQRTMGF